MNGRNLLSDLASGKAKVGVFGLGHVGLPTALGLCELGWHVVGADSDAEKVQLLRRGECPFFEPDLQQLLSKHGGSDRFIITTNIDEAVTASSVLFLCVGTPQMSNGQADLSQVESLARTIAANLSGYKLIVEKSTVPAITGRWIERTVELYAGLAATNSNGGLQHVRGGSPIEFEVASNPEFLQEGTAVRDFFQPERIVCGVGSNRARNILSQLYKKIDCPKLFTDLTTAELIKHAANAFLATKISFINIIADICDAVGADVQNVANGIGMDSRIGRKFLNAGLGFGGYCLPKDIRAFIYLAEQNGVDAKLIEAAEQVNMARSERLIAKARNALWVLSGKEIAVLGLAFKAGTDDVREAPSFRIIRRLLEEHANVRLYDPKAMDQTRRAFPPIPGRVTYCEDPLQAATGADVLLIVTEWDEFRQLDLIALHKLMRVPLIVDGRNLLDPAKAMAAGFEYHCMGRAATAVKRQMLSRPTPTSSSQAGHTLHPTGSRLSAHREAPEL